MKNIGKISGRIGRLTYIGQPKKGEPIGRLGRLKYIGPRKKGEPAGRLGRLWQPESR